MTPDGVPWACEDVMAKCQISKDERHSASSVRKISDHQPSGHFYAKTHQKYLVKTMSWTVFFERKDTQTKAKEPNNHWSRTATTRRLWHLATNDGRRCLHAPKNSGTWVLSWQHDSSNWQKEGWQTS